MIDFDWGSLEDHVDADGNFNPPTVAKPSRFAKTQQFPCSACGGSGKYRGVRLHQPSSECFACGGKGFFLTSEADRAKKRTQRAEGKQRKLATARAAFDEANPGLIQFLIGAAGWSEFARDMVDALDKYGSLTEGQAGAVRKMKATCEAKRAERAVERAAGGREIDLGPIRAMFEAALASGKKLPVYRAAGLVINRAPDHGKNPGALYVKDQESGDYLGKILGTVYSGKPAPGLEAIAADPRAEAVKWGRETGRCSCCGLELTNKESIELGIGPICITKWGL